MLKVIDTLSSNPSYQIFSQPVKIEEAPDYYDVIPYPMDLSTMRTNVVSGKYNENQIIEYAVDMRRIGMNCMDYNLPGSPIYLIAQDYLRSFEVLYQNTFKSIMKRAPKVSSEDHSLIPTPQSKKEKKKTQQPSTPNSSGSVDEKKLQQIKKFFKVIYNHHLAEPFRFPVDLSQAPGYTDLIKRPMDLSQIKKNFEYYADSRANKLIEFYSDLILIFDNCRTYNVEGSTLFNAAEELSDFTQSAFQEHFPGILNSSTPTVPSEVSHINPKTPKSKAKSSSPIDESILTPASKRPPRREKESSITELKDWPDIFIEDKELGNLSISELTQIYNFLQSSEAAQSVAVRERCSQNARKFLKQIQATKSQDGFYSNELYTVANHGTIRTEPSWHSKDYIYPHGYVCRRDLILSVLPLDISVDKEVNPLDYPHIQVTFTTEILEDQNGNPLFRLSVGENILVVESERINQIWNKTFLDTFGEPILRSLGNKFLRCRAILFYLSTCDSVEPFLEQLPVFSTKSYLKVIKAPMWLSEVYDRLIEGMYDNEYDYAWDMRLIFLNSMNYNEVNSEVYCSAQKLMEIFNILFCQWILNIEDFSVFEPAKGLWDDWMTLKYYDARGRSSSEIPEICKITGLAGTTDSPLKFCVSCEDFYHSSVSEGGLSYEDDIDGKIQQLWRCPRCEKMKQALESPQYGSLLPDKRYIRTKIFKSYIYKVANDIGPGWVKATTNTKPNLGKFLSPLGYQFNSKDEALSWMEEEKLLHDKLVSEREEEFIAKQGNPLSQRKKKAKSQRANTRGRKRKQVDLEPESGAETGDVTKEDLGNSNVMLTGKLPHVQYEASRIHFAGLYVPSESEELKMTIFVPENISPSGFSGLDDVIIHQIIEGLPGSNLCRAYQFSDSLQVLDALCKTIRAIIEKKEQRSSADKLLFEKLLYERNYWRNLELNARNQARPPDSKVDSPSTNELMQKYPQYEKKVCQLMIPLVPPEWKFGTITCDEIEFAVHLWEFLHLLNPLVTNQTFGLLDIIKTLASNAIPHFPNPSTIIFDEICCLLTSVLLTETAPFFFSDKQVLQDFLSLHPLNTISWPWVSYLTLYLSSNLRCGRKQYTSDSIMQMFHLVRCFKEESLVLSEFINLLLSHPSFHVQQSSQRSYQENLRYDQFYSKIFSLGFTEQNVTFGAVFDELFSLLTELNDLELLEWFSLLLKHTATFQSAFKEQLSQQVIQSMENSNSTMQATNILSRSVHLNLATSLPVLRLKEPDCYTLSDRMAILHALIQYCSVTPLLSSHNKKIMTELNRDPLSELTNNTSILSPDLQPTPIPKSHKGILKCVFSGIESKNDPHAVEDESEWVTVPSALLQPPTMPSEFASFGESESSNTVEESAIIAQEIPPQPDITEEVSEHDEDLEHANVPKSRGRKKSKSSRDEPVTLKLRLKQPACLRSNLIKIVTARELATREIENMEVSYFLCYS